MNSAEHFLVGAAMINLAMLLWRNEEKILAVAQGIFGGLFFLAGIRNSSVGG